MNFEWLKYFPFILLIGMIYFNRLQSSSTVNLTDKEKIVKAAESSLLQFDPNSCSIALGYTSCRDLKVKALDVFNLLGEPENPVYHDEIYSLKELKETFAFHFSKGIANEYYMKNQTIFMDIINLIMAKKKVEYFGTFGGHSIHMAVRASKEGCKAYLNSYISENELKEIQSLDNNSKIQINKLGEDSDIHLVMEYGVGEKYGNYSSPRSNRFYINHDVYSSNLNSTEIHHQTAVENNVKLHAVAGFQLMNNLPYNQSIQRLQTVSNYWSNASKNNETIHVEMASFNANQFYSYFVTNSLKYIHSLGMNEHELWSMSALFTNSSDIHPPYSPNHFQINEKIMNLIKIFHNEKYLISRIHIHTLNHHTLCYKNNEWEDGNQSLFAGILISFKYCCQENEIIFDKLHVDDNYTIEIDNFRKTELDPNKGLSCWNVPFFQNWRCCTAKNLKCTKVKNLVGLGDHISGGGLIHHKRISRRN